MALNTPVRVPATGVVLDADVTVPPDARAVVVFAHGSGSSRLSPRNRTVAERLTADGLATVLTDLLTREEAGVDAVTAELRFDVSLLAGRLTEVVDWVGDQPGLGALPLGLFGASTGAAAALITAAARPDRVRAVVSRGGRPDLAGDGLPEVRAPVLLIVGERDPQVRQLNAVAATALPALPVPPVLRVVPGATHLFVEPGTLEQAAAMAADWFGTHLA
ncbi:dienelactone hydrolase family protein [Solwaraspora sp. WMMD406]|uniref:dienelactone hydrolase family protein n=1 Tax=Solwaraspora sp. WMMD406 TaxID=3016095 RepID=UPI002417F019|nr:dienelactone hydrolase family protein [Solwaraspora sp. WMMD406]MDG4765761.1 dienelactone hydrolase family protein [Solwaraspora sp. WMMD406]